MGSVVDIKVKRTHEMSELERAIVLMVWEDVQKLPLYQNYRKYERGFCHDGKKYRYRCKFKVQNGFLQLIDTQIEYEQVVIELVH